MQNATQETTLAPRSALRYGRVATGASGFFEIECEETRLYAERAASCLLDPLPGDLVLTSADELGDVFILAVLRRKENEPARLTFEQDLRIRSVNGAVRLTASEDLDLISGREMTVEADKIRVQSATHLVESQNMTLRVGRLFAGLQRAKLAADAVEQVFRRFTERLSNAWRFVSGSEEIQTQSSRRVTAETHFEHAKNIIQTADETLSCNANRINLC